MARIVRTFSQQARVTTAALTKYIGVRKRMTMMHSEPKSFLSKKADALEKELRGAVEQLFKS
jgi:hypothetical protein